MPFIYIRVRSEESIYVHIHDQGNSCEALCEDFRSKERASRTFVDSIGIVHCIYQPLNCFLSAERRANVNNYYP